MRDDDRLCTNPKIGLQILEFTERKSKKLSDEAQMHLGECERCMDTFLEFGIEDSGANGMIEQHVKEMVEKYGITEGEARRGIIKELREESKGHLKKGGKSDSRLN